MLDLLLYYLQPYLAPDIIWPVGLFALGALVYTAWVDGRTGYVPFQPVALASLVLAICIICQHWLACINWYIPAVLFAAAIWLINRTWRWAFKQDALGLGDASWSFLATLAYGWKPVVFAWGLGSIMALVYLGLQRLRRRRQGHVHLAPYLMIALLIGLYLDSVDSDWTQLAQRLHI